MTIVAAAMRKLLTLAYGSVNPAASSILSTETLDKQHRILRDRPQQLFREVTGFTTHEVADLTDSLDRLPLRIGQAPIVVDARHAFDVATHRDDAAGVRDDRWNEQLRPRTGNVHVDLRHGSHDAGVRTIGRDGPS